MSELKSMFDDETDYDLLARFQTLDERRSENPGYANINNIPEGHYPVSLVIHGDQGWITEEKIAALKESDENLNLIYLPNNPCRDKAKLVLSYEALYDDGDVQDPDPYPDFSSPEDLAQGFDRVRRLLSLCVEHGILSLREARPCGWGVQQDSAFENRQEILSL